MSEQRPRVKVLDVVDPLPEIRRRVGWKALLGQWKRRRAEAKHIEQDRLVIAGIPVGQKTALRSPAMRDGWPTVAGPDPIGPTIEELGQRADLGLLLRVAIKVSGARQHAREQK